MKKKNSKTNKKILENKEKKIKDKNQNNKNKKFF